jgi:membrane fusion protein, heavy metal efflux system
MSSRFLRRSVTLLVVLAAVAAAAWLTRDAWWSLVAPADPAAEEGAHAHAHAEKDRVRLSPQARANLGLVVKPVQPQTYWRLVHVPGTVVERRGKSDRGVTAPLAGVVRRVVAVPGDLVRPGAELFRLGLTSEYLQTSQTELNKIAQELKFAQAEKERVEKLAEGGAVAQNRLIEAQNQVNRLAAARKAQRNDLAQRGLTGPQIDHVKEITVQAPARTAASDSPPPESETQAPLYELEELKVQLGEQVQAGQVLAYLADHQFLYVEGRGFKEDAALLARAAAQGWPVAAAFTEEAEGDWPPFAQELTIQNLANTIDPVSQTFPFYIPLTNQHLDYERGGKAYRLWRFKPGQRVRLGVRVQEFRGVFVLPADAVVREGPNAYVFRQNGSLFERKPVHIVYEDSASAVLANDGSVAAGSFLAHGAAAALNRALKAQAGGEDGGHGHDHHGHSH